MHDISHTLALKRWWRLRTNDSLWAEFMKAKYCSRVHIVKKKALPGNSQAWKNLVWARDKGEKHIKWIINSGNTNFWLDQWCELGPLNQILNIDIQGSRAKVVVRDFINNGKWDVTRLNTVLPGYIVVHITNIVIGPEEQEDYAIWDQTVDGIYSNRSAWNIIRQTKSKNVFISNLWHKESSTRLHAAHIH